MAKNASNIENVTIKNKLSILIPVYNEEKFIKKVVDRVFRAKTPNFSKEVIIVDDGSTDGTVKILKKLKQKYGSRLNVVYNKKNMGKGFALRCAISIATGEYCIFQDADFEYNPNDYSKLIFSAKKKKADAVFGSRFLNKNLQMSKMMNIGNKVLTKATNMIYGSNLSDMETCYKMVKTKTLKNLNLQSNGFEIEPEITSKLLKKRIMIYEVPISYNSRGYSEGKKIRYADGIRALFCLVRESLK